MEADPTIWCGAEVKENLKLGKEAIHIYKRY
jgi:hypothetical protein